MLDQYTSISKASKCKAGPVQYTSNMVLAPGLAASLYHPQASQTRKAQGRESAFHTIYPFLESYDQEGLSLLRAAEGKKLSGIQLHNTQRRADLSPLPAHLMSTYSNFW